MELGAAIVAGHICLNIIPQFDRHTPVDFHKQFQPGSLTKVDPEIFSTGGPVSNTGLVLHMLGIPTQLIARAPMIPLAQRMSPQNGWPAQLCCTSVTRL